MRLDEISSSSLRKLKRAKFLDVVGEHPEQVIRGLIQSLEDSGIELSTQSKQSAIKKFRKDFSHDSTFFSDKTPFVSEEYQLELKQKEGLRHVELRFKILGNSLQWGIKTDYMMGADMNDTTPISLRNKTFQDIADFFVEKLKKTQKLIQQAKDKYETSNPGKYFQELDKIGKKISSTEESPARKKFRIIAKKHAMNINFETKTSSSREVFIARTSLDFNRLFRIKSDRIDMKSILSNADNGYATDISISFVKALAEYAKSMNYYLIGTSGDSKGLIFEFQYSSNPEAQHERFNTSFLKVHEARVNDVLTFLQKEKESSDLKSVRSAMHFSIKHMFEEETND